VSAAEQIAHRPGLAPVLGLRAGSNGLSIITQTGWAEESHIEVRRFVGGRIMSQTNVWSHGKAFLPSRRKVPSVQRFLCGLVVLGLFFGATGQALSDLIYWGDFVSNDIRRANLDGTGQTILVSGQDHPKMSLDLAGGQMYWASGSDIRRGNLDGSGETTLISGLSRPTGPALDIAGGRMYWSDVFTGEILRANLDGSEPTVLIRGPNGPREVKLDLIGGKMYWPVNGDGTIRRANLDGSSSELLVNGLIEPVGLALDLAGGKIYWTDYRSGDIRRANLDGSGQEILIQNLPGPGGIDLDVVNRLMYWADASGDIRRANFDGTGQETLIKGLNNPVTIALDLGAPGTAVYFALAAPASVPPGTPFDVTITALDPYGNTAVNYQGTVTFSTSDTDPGVVMPADYTFMAADAGVHTFTGGLTLSTPGDQTITATDMASGMTRTVTVTVVPPG
jgi:hypothetical protein